jgi:putative ABC transport system substrate-binding protein
MRRREPVRLFPVQRAARVLSLLLVACAAPAAAQSERVVRIGILLNPNLGASVEPFVAEMRRLGYEEGRNLALDVRRADTPEQGVAFAAALVAPKPDLLIGVGSRQAEALKRATPSIPIVIVGVSDPVGLGIVTSLARPGGNVTGIANYNPELAGKRLELISGMVPGARRIAFLYNPTNTANLATLKETEAAAARAGSTVLVLVPARSPDELRRALQAAVDSRADALIVVPELLTLAHDPEIIAFTLAHRLPAIFAYPYQAAAGGLIAYGSDPADEMRRAAAFAGKIVKGAKPADLPVENPATFRLVLNLATAEKLGVSFPPAIMLLADKVIE